MSSCIQVAVNGKVVSALIDTGSDVTLLTQSAVSRLKLTINTRQTIPQLRGVTGKPLRILGAVRPTISIGYQVEKSQWIPVVPDEYLDTDMLLGLDLLSVTPLKWDAPKGIVVWGDASYPSRSIPRYKSREIKKA